MELSHPVVGIEYVIMGSQVSKATLFLLSLMQLELPPEGLHAKREPYPIPCFGQAIGPG